MTTLVFATNNVHKLEELRAVAGDRFEIKSLPDIGCHDDIPEDADTLEGNALAKARWVSERYGVGCIADDTGLEVDALGGRPGVHSARFAPGSDHDSAANMRHLLALMQNVPDEARTARFRTVIALMISGREPELFQGAVEGRILDAPAGEGGFGYDPLFVPDGWDKSFGQATAEEKNSVSHRARACRALIDGLARITK